MEDFVCPSCSHSGRSHWPPMREALQTSSAFAPKRIVCRPCGDLVVHAPQRPATPTSISSSSTTSTPSSSRFTRSPVPEQPEANGGSLTDAPASSSRKPRLRAEDQLQQEHVAWMRAVEEAERSKAAKALVQAELDAAAKAAADLLAAKLAAQEAEAQAAAAVTHAAAANSTVEISAHAADQAAATAASAKEAEAVAAKKALKQKAGFASLTAMTRLAEATKDAAAAANRATSEHVKALAALNHARADVKAKSKAASKAKAKVRWAETVKAKADAVVEQKQMQKQITQLPSELPLPVPSFTPASSAPVTPAASERPSVASVGSSCESGVAEAEAAVLNRATRGALCRPGRCL